VGPYSRFKLEDLRAAADSLGVTLHPVEVNEPYDFEAAFKTTKRVRADAAVVLLTYAFYGRREQLAAAALSARVPTMHDNNEMVKAGGLMSYGATFEDTWGRAAYFVDRILKGAKPSELPVEQVSTLRLTVNQQTARVLGIAIPQSILIRADEVIR
jgi:putative ABC transport system substrate-binding protein